MRYFSMANIFFFLIRVQFTDELQDTIGKFNTVPPAQAAKYSKCIDRIKASPCNIWWCVGKQCVTRLTKVVSESFTITRIAVAEHGDVFV